MATKTLFAYNLEEQDGKLIITVHGELAKTAISHLSEELSQGRGLALIQRLSPLGPLRGLLNRSIAESDESDAGLMDLEKTGQALDADQILNQGVDQSLEAFERELAQFKVEMEGSKMESGSSTPVGKK